MTNDIKNIKDAPVEAFCFKTNEVVKLEELEDGVHKFNSLARTTDSLDHWYWGPCIHDFDGMTMAKTIPVDWRHDDAVVLGYANSKSIKKEGLFIAGALTPFGDSDMASEIIHKSKKGVPYQTSVQFGRDNLKTEYVQEKSEAIVNGKTVKGPVTIFRKWDLEGLAICLHGEDPNTRVSFKKTEVTKLNDKPQENEIKQEVKPPDETQVKPVDPYEFIRTQSKLFITEFGDTHGANLFSKGITIDVARQEFAKLVNEENTALKKQLDEINKSKTGGSPVKFSDGNGEKQPEAKTAEGSVSKFAKTIVMPARKRGNTDA